MKKEQTVRPFVYVLFLSFVLMMTGLPRMTAEAGENLPIGEMISKGEVKFEVRETWKNVESSHFPLFQGTRVKTENGVAAVTLSNNTQIEVGEKSLFSISRKDGFVLTQGSIRFRIPAPSETTFRAGNISVLKSRPLQPVIGSISIHSNGAVTVESVQGEISVLNQDRVLVAGLSSTGAVTIPSATVKTAPTTMVAQTGQTGEVARGSEGKEGVQGPSIGFMIATQSEGGKGVGSSGSGGLFPTIREIIRGKLCAP